MDTHFKLYQGFHEPTPENELAVRYEFWGWFTVLDLGLSLRDGMLVSIHTGDGELKVRVKTAEHVVFTETHDGVERSTSVDQRVVGWVMNKEDASTLRRHPEPHPRIT